MLPSELVENLRSLIVSHARHDEGAFRRSAEAIVRELSVGNRPADAKALRGALNVMAANGDPKTPAVTLSSLSDQAKGLISVVSGHPADRLFFTQETQFALDRVVLEQRACSMIAEAGLRPRTRLLFYGPPGCGKTAAARWLATELSIPLGVVRLGSLITSFVGETGSNLQRVLAVAEQSPMVLLLDEADAIAKNRNDANDVGELRRVVNSLLQGLDSLASRRSLVILATNHSHLFDPALWRRFDDVVEFPLPTNAERLALLKHLTSGLKIKGSLVAASRKTASFSFADIERAVMETAKSKLLTQQDVTAVECIIAEGQRWRRKMQTAAGVARRRR